MMRFSASCGMDQLLDAFVQGEQATHAEQHERDHERPEVALATESERVLGVRPLLRLLAAEQQQRLVAGVGEGVGGLGEQARRRRQQESHELGDGDAEVGAERGQDRVAAPFVHSHPPWHTTHRPPPCGRCRDSGR